MLEAFQVHINALVGRIRNDAIYSMSRGHLQCFTFSFFIFAVARLRYLFGSFDFIDLSLAHYENARNGALLYIAGLFIALHFYKSLNTVYSPRQTFHKRRAENKTK